MQTRILILNQALVYWESMVEAYNTLEDKVSFPLREGDQNVTKFQFTLYCYQLGH